MKLSMRLLLALLLVVGLFLAVVPQTIRAASNAVWVCPTGNCGHTLGTDSFNTIQAGINAVASDGTVHVAAGIYTGSLTIDKGLTLQGDGATPEVRGTVDVTAAEVTVRSFKFVGPATGAASGYIVRLSGASNALLEDDTLSTIGGSGSNCGLLIANTTGATIQRVTVGNVSGDDPAGIMLSTNANGNTLDTLTIDGISSTGFASGVKLASVQNNAFTNLTIANVTTSGTGRPLQGIYVAGGSGNSFSGVSISGLQMGAPVRAAFFESAANCTLRGLRFDASSGTTLDKIEGFTSKSSTASTLDSSEIAHATRGVLVDGGSATVINCALTANVEHGVLVRTSATVVLLNNSIAGNAALGLENKNSPGPAVDASRNWWGSATGPIASNNPGGAGQKITGPVTYSPWLGDGRDTSTATGFQPNVAPLYGVAAQLAFAAQPGGATPGAPFAAQPVVRAQDAAGNLAINYASAVRIAIGTNPPGGTLSGTAQVSAVGGVATFNNLAIDRRGIGYTLVASASGLSSATSSPFNVSDAAPTVTGLAPAYVRAGSGALTLTVNGTGFTSDAQVQWNGAERRTTFVSATQLTAEIPASDVAAAGTAMVRVANPDGQTSGTQTLSIRPVPPTVYVNAGWAGLAPDADPDGDGPATQLGYDAFATLQAALNGVAPGGSVVVVGGGTIGGGLTIQTAGLTLDLNGAVVGPGSPAFTVSADDVTIHGGTLDGMGGALGTSAIVVSAGVARLWIYDCEIRHWPADGIHLNGTVNGLKVLDNYIHDNGGDGIEINGTPAGTVVIQGNSFRANAGYGIHAASGGVTAQYNAWGHVDGPAAGDGIAGDVDADPWLFGRVYADLAPGPAQVRERETFALDVRADAYSLFGAEFALTFDPAMLEIVGTTASGTGYLAGALIPTVTFDNAKGTLSYHASRQAGEPAYNGSGGRLLTVHFRAREIAGAAATTAVDIPAASVRLAATGGVNIRPESIVGDSLTILGTTTVRGVARLQGRGDWSGAVVDAAPGTSYGADPAAVTTDAWGSYEFAAPDDRYAITIAKPRYLSARATLAVAGSTQVLATVELLGGDVNGNQSIDIADVTAISGVLFDTAVDPATTGADINYDGRVDILDLAIAAGNYGLSATPWEPS